MKKITLLLLMCFYSFLGSAQVALTEGFEGTAQPTAGTWALGSGTWAVFDNGVGIVNTWTGNAGVSTPPNVYEGTRSAYMNGAQDGIPAGSTAQDWLVTPAVTVPTNGQLRFFTRLSLLPENGTIFQIRVSTTSQTDPASFTVLQEWTESSLLNTYNVFEEKVVPLTQPAGSTVYVAFVMLKPGTGTADRWFVDAVKIVQECVAPTNLSVSAVTQTGANLSWLNPGGANSWEIEIIPGTATQSGHGVIYNGNAPYAATGTATGAPLVQAPFLPNTEYKFYVRAACSNTGSSSAWVGPFTFTTGQPGFTCSSAINVPLLPYSTTDNTANYGDLTDVNQGPNAGCGGGTTNYMTGNDVFYSYTPTVNEVISITMTPTNNWAGVFVYNGCANVGVSCIAGVGNSAGANVPRVIPAVALTAGQTYVIAISTNATPQTTPYTLVIQKVNCTPPNALAAAGIGTNSATLSWGNPGNLASSWQVKVQTAGTGVPTGAGTTTTNNTAYPSGPLNPSTAYEFYVRADCGDGTFSAWAGPYNFNTLCATFNVPFQEGFNSTSATQFCWTILNVNNDDDSWNMDYATTPFEGNQSAVLYTDINAGNNDDWLISPTINVTGNQRLKYHYRVQSVGEPDAFEVKLSTTGVGAANFTQTIVPLATYNNITYVEKIVNLTGITGPINIGFHVPQGGPDGWRLYIDNVIVEDIPTCPVPSALAANPSTTGAQLSWTAGNVETQWQVVVQAPGAGVPAATAGGTPVGNPFTTTTPLTPATQYEYYVRAYCAANDVSQWVGPFLFTTLCNALPIPFQEGFNSTSPTQTCWTVLNLNGDTDAWNMDYPTAPFEGNQSANMYTDINGGNNDDWLISPTLILTGNQRLKYHYRVQSATEPDAFEVKLSTSGIAPASFTQTVVPLATYNNITYVEKIVNLTGVTGQVNIGFHVPPGGPDGWRIYIDNVIVEDIPSCPDPTALAAAPTTTGAQLSWIAGNTETQWQVVVQAPGTGVPAATAGGTPVGNPFTTTTPLTPATQYEYYVRAYCAANDQSQWVGPFLFTTLCNAFPTPFFEGFNTSSPTESCWTVLNLNGDNDAWDMNYTANPFEGNQSANLNTDFNNGDNDDWLISPTIILAANQRIKFHYRVQSSSEPNDFEVLMSTTGIAPASFTQTIVPLQSYNNTTYVQSITNLTGTTGPVNFAWHVPNGGLDGWRIYIDNVIIEDIPPCPEPLDIEISCISSQGANISWTQGGTETSWQVAVVPAGSGVPAPGDIVTVTPDPLYYAQGLSPETEYDFYVRAVCPGMGDGFGSWVFSGFTTPTTSVTDAEPFCASAGQSILFQNTDDSMNVTEYGEVACLGSTPNPVWYYLQVDTPGDLNFQLIQNTAFDDNGNPTGNALDVDFVAFGPFTSLNQACGEIALSDCPTCPFSNVGSSFYPFGNIVDCSYSAAAIENFSIQNAQPGEIYAVLITNFNGDPGQILLEQLASSTATTNCNILYNVDLGADQNLCGVNQTTITATVTTPGQSAAPTFQWFMDGAPITPTIVGNTALSQTIQVSTQGSHIYSVVITVENSANTEPITDAVTIVLGPAVAATAPQEYALCDDASNDGFATFDLTTLNAQALGTLDASQYTVSYHLTQADADANTAAITPANAFVNTVADTQTIYVRVQSNLVNACFDVVEAVLTVKDLPVTTLDPSYSICSGDSVTITGVPTNYTPADATFQWLLNGNPITGETNISIIATQPGTYTLQVTLNGCTNTTQTTVIVNQLPQFTLPSDFSFCTGNSATIAVTPGNFNAATATYTWTLNGGAPLAETGSSITVTTPGVYEVTVNNGGCTTTDSVTITEVSVPVAEDPLDVTACESYTLPVLPTGNKYFLQSNGAGTEVPAGTVVETSTVFYVFYSNGANCSDENSFEVVINERPTVSVTGSCQNSEYIIEAEVIDEPASNYVFSWTDAQGNAIGGNTSSITVSVSGIYNVTVSAVGSTVACSTTESFEANGTTCNIQKGISPNGDGKNDSFDLSGLQVRKISIFNRYGKIVYDFSNYTNQWYGQSNKGDELPDGTYYYSFEREGGESKTGWIYINRERN